jgi:Flp pilus assembly protein TadB
MEANTTINLFWVILAAATLLLTFIGMLLAHNSKTNREAERFESWLKTHEKEIQSLQVENKAIRESQALQNSTFMQEIRKVEQLMGELKTSNGIIQNTLNILIRNGHLKPQDNEG